MDIWAFEGTAYHCQHSDHRARDLPAKAPNVIILTGAPKIKQFGGKTVAGMLHLWTHLEAEEQGEGNGS